MNDLHVIVRIIGRGYGTMSAVEYSAIPATVRHRVELLAVCPTEEKARWVWRHLPQGWRGARPGVAERAREIERLAWAFVASEGGEG